MKEILIYGRIGSDVKSKAIINELNGVGDVTVRINSPGGSIIEGLAIYNALRRHSGAVTTVNDGAAWSMGSVLFMAGDTRLMASGSTLMIHSALTTATGNAEEFAKVAAGLRANE